MTYTLAPYAPQQWFDNDGNPASGCKLFIYAAGTTTKVDTFSDASGTPNTNPIILDSSGRAKLFFAPGSYKFVLAPSTDMDPPSNPLATEDNIDSYATFNAGSDAPGIAGENITAGDLVYLSTAGELGHTIGRWYKMEDGSVSFNTLQAGFLARDVGFATLTAASGAGVVVRIAGIYNGLFGLTEGTNYTFSTTPGALSAVTQPNQRIIAVAISATEVIVSPTAPPPFSIDIPGTPSTAGLCYFQVTNGGLPAKQWKLTDSGGRATSTLPQLIGFGVANTGAGGGEGIIRLQGQAYSSKGSSLTPNTLYYLDTAGGITATKPRLARVVGYAISANTLNIIPSPPVRFEGDVTASGNVGAGETTLFTYTFTANPGETLGQLTIGQGLTCFAYGQTAGNGNNKTIRAYVGGTLVVSSGAIAANNQPWLVEIWEIGPSSTQVTVIARVTVGATQVLGATQILSVSPTITVTGQATADNDILYKASGTEMKG